MERTELTALIHGAAAEVGASAPRIADHIVVLAFPDTAEASRREGCETIFRRGLIQFVSRYLRKHRISPTQADFGEIAEDFRPLVAALKSTSYTVPSLGEVVEVSDLIRNPPMLDEARRYMRTKSTECLSEAKALDLLYEAVTGAVHSASNDDAPNGTGRDVA